MPEDELTKMELRLIDKIVGALGMRSFQKLLWDKVEQAFRFTFRNTQVNYGFTHAMPDPLALKYLEERTFILSDKTQDRLTGNLRWELLEGIRNTESISEIKKRLDGIFTGMRDYEIERIARTETLNAMNAGRLEAYEASEVTHYKMWRAAINNKRTAADSRRLHGQIQELSDPFVDPKTGEGVMHPPNRPNCRCAMIPLRKLPENVVRKSGQMYAADEMVGKIEIDIISLQKGEKRVWVKATSKRKGHYRKVKGAKKVEEVGKKQDTVMDKEVKVISDRLDGYADDYDKEGKESLKNDCNKIVELLKNGQAKEAVEVFAGSDLKYDIGNTYDDLNDYVEKKYVREKFGEDWGTKPGEYVAYRSGDIKGEKRGIFLSMDKKGAEAYSRGEEVVEYKVVIKNPLVGKRVEEVYSKLVGKSVSEVYSEKNKADNINEFWRQLDAKVMKLAKKEGYDSIVYTKPAPPSLRELVLISSKGIISKGGE